MTNKLYSDFIPSYEPERVAALQLYLILSSPGLTVFDRFVSVMARLLDAPIALISLVRETDVVFVGNAGLPEARVLGREESMCSVAILSDEITVYEDILLEPCTLVNPEVAQRLNLGFYAGVPLRSPNGMALGSLCALDHQPRTLSAAEAELLTQFGLVAQELLAYQAAKATQNAQPDSFPTQYDEAIHQALNRLGSLLRLRSWDAMSDPGEDDRYTASQLQLACFQAQQLREQLQTATAEFQLV